MNRSVVVRIHFAFVFGAVLAAILAGCTAQKTAAPTETTANRNQTQLSVENIVGVSPMAAMAHAVAFRMNGRYADNVPISIDPDGRVLSYPSPADITEQSRPLALADGWWLDRRGVGPTSVFTRYTYEEYAALTQAPSVEVLKASVIAGAHITELVKLPVTLSEALTDTIAVNAYLRTRSPQVRRP